MRLSSSAFELVGERHQRLHGRLAFAAPLDRSHAILRAHRRAVVEYQAVAQRHAPGETVGVGLVAGDHLRMRDQVLVETIELIPDHVAVDEHHGGGGPHRIGIGEVGLRHVAQHARALRERRAGEPPRYGADSGGRLQQIAA